MPDETLHLILDAAGWLIAALLAVNVFFLRDFMHRVQNALDELSRAIKDHSNQIGDINVSFSERVARMDEQISELKRIKKNGKSDIWTS